MSSETTVITYKTKRGHNTEDHNRNHWRCWNCHNKEFGIRRNRFKSMRYILMRSSTYAACLKNMRLRMMPSLKHIYGISGQLTAYDEYLLSSSVLWKLNEEITVCRKQKDNQISHCLFCSYHLGRGKIFIFWLHLYRETLKKSGHSQLGCNALLSASILHRHRFPNSPVKSQWRYAVPAVTQRRNGLTDPNSDNASSRFKTLRGPHSS
jgi:hypothetical protein